MRVRLVRPLLAEIAQLDTLATAQAPGYDPDFQEPRAGARQEKPPIQVPAQIEVTAHEVLQQSMAGNVPDSRLVLVMDYEDLARRGLIDPVTAYEMDFAPGGQFQVRSQPSESNVRHFVGELVIRGFDIDEPDGIAIERVHASSVIELGTDRLED